MSIFLLSAKTVEVKVDCELIPQRDESDFAT